ncbi:MAG: hypothetical protein AAF708_17535, partial [Deinococcota bacterium]
SCVTRLTLVLYTLDTNFVSQILNGNVTALDNLRNALQAGHAVTLNAICYYEIHRGLYVPTYQRKKRVFDGLVSIYGLLELNHVALDEAVTIYQDLRQ